jgi:hypothetical protein
MVSVSFRFFRDSESSLGAYAVKDTASKLNCTKDVFTVSKFTWLSVVVRLIKPESRRSDLASYLQNF